MHVVEEIADELLRLSKGVWAAAYSTALGIKKSGLYYHLPSGWEVEAMVELDTSKLSPEKLHKYESKVLIREAFFLIEEIKEMQQCFGGSEVPEEFTAQLNCKIENKLQKLLCKLRGGVLQHGTT